MRKFFDKLEFIAAICLVAVSIGSSPAHGDALPGEEARDASLSAKNAAPPTTSDAGGSMTPRRHVKHLRAHKKFDAEATGDPTQPTDITDRAQNTFKNAARSGGNEKAAANGTSPLVATKVVARPRAKIALPRKNDAKKAQPDQTLGHKSFRQRDFITDIFGGDD